MTRKLAHGRARAVRPLGVAIAVGAACAMMLSACSSSSKSGGSSSSSTGSKSSSASSSGLTTADIAKVKAFTGGTLGKADSSKSPIKVGIVVSNTGQFAQDWIKDAFTNAISIVNDHLSGIQGHPIQFVTCDFGTSAQQGQDCGSKFANDPSIKLVLYGGGTTGGAQLHAANGGKKVYLCGITSPEDATAKNTFCTASGALGTGTFITYIKKYVKAKSVAILSVNDPIIAAIINGVKKQFQSGGISAKAGLAAVGSTDVTSAVVASGAQTADVILLQTPSVSECVPFIKALNSLGVKAPVVSLGQCADPTVAKTLGDTPKYTYYDYSNNQQVPDAAGHVKVWEDANKSYIDSTGSNSIINFSNGLLMAKIFNELGPDNLTTASVAAKLEAFTGPTFIGETQEKFGAKPYTSVGSLRARFFTYKGNGTWVDATGGAFVSPPAG